MRWSGTPAWAAALAAPILKLCPEYLLLSAAEGLFEVANKLVLCRRSAIFVNEQGPHPRAWAPCQELKEGFHWAQVGACFAQESVGPSPELVSLGAGQC